jgi:polysaccharide deacetylase 2 family uncharacterized protein YibQ
MFSKKPPAASQPRSGDKPGALAAARTQVLAAAANPYVAASGAAFLFMATLETLVVVTGDPKAGAPIVRLSLDKAAAAGRSVPGWREALSAEPAGEAPLVSDTFELSQSPLGPIGGEAIITFPGGSRSESVAAGAGSPLVQAPIAGFFEAGPGGGPLPIFGPDGRPPSEAYARPFTPNGKPRVALVVGGLGLNPATTRRAIEGLPPEITLSFAPYAEGLQGWIDLARANGHEVLLETPMEPVDYPANDPGPYTLLAARRPDETVKKLEWLMSRASGYFGLTNYLGSRFMGSAPAMGAFTGALRQRGLAFVDDGSGARIGGGIQRASANRIIDDDLAAESIARQLAALEAVAKDHGQALGSGFAYPVTIDQAARWAQSAPSRGLQLAPASAVMSRR